MKSLIKGVIVKRYIVYPIIFLFVWAYAYQNFPHFFLVKLTTESIKTAWIDTFHLHISMKTCVHIFGFLFGYVYGTISLAIKVREFRGALMIVLFLIKCFASTMATCLFGFAYFIELALCPLIFLAVRKYKKKKAIKKGIKEKMEQKAFYDELEKILSQK